MIEVQFREMEKRFDEMEDRFDKLEVKFDRFVERLDSIYDKLAGNQLNPIGIVKEIEDLKTEVAQLKEFRSRIYWTISIMFVIGGIVGTMITLFLQYLQVK